jgi:hypothetical protein
MNVGEIELEMNSHVQRDYQASAGLATIFFPRMRKTTSTMMRTICQKIFALIRAAQRLPRRSIRAASKRNYILVTIRASIGPELA